MEVLVAESVRLEQLAREFANLGRLPEGPPAAVDLAELMSELVRTSVPPEVNAPATRLYEHARHWAASPDR